GCGCTIERRGAKRIMEERVTVRFGETGTGPQGYDVCIGEGLLSRLAEHVGEVAPAHRYAVIADSNVAELYGEKAVTAVEAGGRSCDLYSFPAGEARKNRETWAALSDRMLEAGHGRDSAVLALGGGVTGDLAGFVAATYLRGLP